MHSKVKKMFATILGIVAFGVGYAQNSDTLTVRGMIYCSDSTLGVIPDVEIININRQWGVLSNDRGEFKIRMLTSDTLLFTTVQHYDVYYTLKQDRLPGDTIEIVMYQDSIWLSVVTIFGQKKLEEFKREFLALDLPDHDISLRLPVIDKYANQHLSELGVVEIKGALTYLTDKIQNLSNLKRNLRNPVEK